MYRHDNQGQQRLTFCVPSRYLYSFLLSLDACFRVKRYKVSSVEKDPIIDNGWAFFVEETEYREQLKKYVGQKEVCAYISCGVAIVTDI